MGLDANNDISEYKAVELARIQGLKVGKLKLMGMPQTRSVLFWYDSWVDAEVKGEVRPVHVPAHTIIINLEVVKGDNCSREILHEVFHDDNHYIFFRTQQLNNNNIRQIKMVELKKQNVKPKKNRLPIIEWQAKMGSLALQMPATLTRNRINEQKAIYRKYIDHWGVLFEKIGFHLSDEMNVPRYLVRQRMLLLGYWQSRGALNWIDCKGFAGASLGLSYYDMRSHYAAPFMFSRSSCPNSHYTYCITPEQFIKLCTTNEEFSRRIESGGYVYVDGHVCIQDPLFVETTGYGLRLSAWANEHVDLCCMRFENIFVIDESGYEFRLESVHADEEYCRHYVEWIVTSENASKQEINRARAEFLRSLPNTPGEMISVLMRRNGWVRVEEMAERAMVSVGTVKNWRKEKEKLSLESTVRIIIALHLPPWIQGRFLEVSGIKLGYSEYDLAIKELLDCYFMDDMRKANEFMKDNGFKPFKEVA